MSSDLSPQNDMFFERTNELIETILSKDPAARTRLEVILCYPGFHALGIHLFSNKLWKENYTTLARFISHLSRVLTGIEIHPGAEIGRRVFIDHGMGVVIGETAIVGDDVVIYQGVTLGAGQAARMGSQSRGQKRHPTLEKGVVVGSNAEVQGDITVGEYSRVASGSIVLKDVPANSVVVGVPGRVIYQNNKRLPDESIDIEAEAIKSLQKSLHQLQAEVAELNKKLTPGKDGEAKNGGASSPAKRADEDDPLQSNQEEDPVDIFLHGAGI